MSLVSRHKRERMKMNREQRLVKLLLATPISASLVFGMLHFASTRVDGQEPQVLSVQTHIPLAGVKGRIDHFSVDVKGQRLFVAAVENHTLEVIDLKSGQRVHTIADLAEPQGVFYDASTSHLFVACGLDGVTKIFDPVSGSSVLASSAPVSSIGTGVTRPFISGNQPTLSSYPPASALARTTRPGRMRASSKRTQFPSKASHTQK